MNTLWRGATAIGIVVASCAVIAAVGSSASGSAAVPVDELVPALSRAATARDQLPNAVRQGPAGRQLEAATVRQLADTPSATYWSGQDAKANVCLAVTLKPSGVTASACAALPEFYQHGVSVGVFAGATADTGTAAQLLPTDVSLESSTSAASVALAESASTSEGHLLIFDAPSDIPQGSIELDRTSSASNFEVKVPDLFASAD